MIDLDDEFHAPEPPASRLMRLRDYQVECLTAVDAAFREFNRILCVLAGGCGKTVLFSNVARKEVDAGGRVLILAHTDELLEQAHDKLMKSTGLEASREKAEDHADPYASIVIASIQTLAREGRLVSFPEDHFSLVIVDEAHRSLSPSYMRVLNYFHFGMESLAENWQQPMPGVTYKFFAKVIGWTATNSRGDKRSLGEFYQKVAFEYGLLEAVRDGYLVRPMVKNIPLKIDMRGVKVSRSGQGADLDIHEVAERITPFLREIAKQFVLHARHLKCVVFMPSVDTARLLSEAMKEYGLNALFVSGACQDREVKIDHFRNFRGPIILCNALLVVEGFDVPDINGVSVLRPTKIWSFYVQANVRGTRILPGVIDDLEDRDARLAAIASSSKPHFTILDFLWLSDRMDLVSPCDLVTSRPKVREQMVNTITASTELVDLLSAEQQAERDFLVALEREAKRHARKQARVIDPISYAVSLGDAALAEWEPETRWDELPPTKAQLDFLAKQHFDVSQIKYRGLATKITLRLLQRLKSGLCSYEQMTFLSRLGVPEDKTVMMSRKEASALIDVTLAEKKARREATADAPPASPVS